MVDAAVWKELILSKILHEYVSINKTVHTAIFPFNSRFYGLILIGFLFILKFLARILADYLTTTVSTCAASSSR